MTISPNIRLLIAAAKKAKAVLPPGIVDEFDRPTPTAPQYSSTAAATAMVAAVLAGKDPATDKATRDALVEAQIAGFNIDRLVADADAERRADAVRDHADGIIDALAVVVAAAQEAADTARTRDGLDLSDNAAQRLSADALPAWANARAALARADDAAVGWHQLAIVARKVPDAADRRYRALVLADLGADALDHALSTQRTSARELAEDGHQLELADWDTWADRLKRIRTDRNEAERAVADERHRAVVSVYGHA